MTQSFTADFETIVDPNQTRVWAVGICEVGKPDSFIYGNSIEYFMDWCESRLTNDTVYFHNLKFDGKFIIDWLFRNGFEHVKDRKEARDNTFTTLISDMNVFYSITIFFKVRGKNVKRIQILDSMKILPLSVESIAKSFDLPIRKLEIDYKAYREEGHELTPEEVDYLKNDVVIMSMALGQTFNKGLNKMTVGSNALHDFKSRIGKKWNKYFPIVSYDSFIRKSYKGGWTYCDPRFQGKNIGEGIVLDVNSLYPSRMYYDMLPYGQGEWFDGEYEYDEIYPLYVINFTCQFEIKKDHLPTIQLKNTLGFNPTEYLTSSERSDGTDEEIEFTMTSVDFELFKDHYDIYNLRIYGGYKFKATDILFKDYIDYWINEKIKCKKSGDKGGYQLAKLMLNNLYGKLALNPNVTSKIPYYDKEAKKIRFALGEPETREPIYIPAGTFITAYARNTTIRAAQKCYDRFLYADTDSLHLIGTELPKELEIDPNKLGAWDFEFHFEKARYLRQKCYFEYGYEPNNPDDKFAKIACAGMSERAKKNVTWENFHIGNSFEGNLKAKTISGGTVLEDALFEIKPH